MKKSNTNGLKEAAKARNAESIRSVNEAIDRMKVKKQKVTFASVAKESGISRATLYKNPMIKERIESLKALGKKDEKYVQRAVRSDPDDREKQLREEVVLLRKEKKLLVEQLIDMLDLIEENNKLRVMVERMKEQMRS